jgi:hypothetical protein
MACLLCLSMCWGCMKMGVRSLCMRQGDEWEGGFGAAGQCHFLLGMRQGDEWERGFGAACQCHFLLYSWSQCVARKGRLVQCLFCSSLGHNVLPARGGRFMVLPKSYFAAARAGGTFLVDSRRCPYDF